MKTAEAIERLIYTISNENKPNITDKKALNKVVSDLNKMVNDNVKENILFAKLYAVMLRDYDDIEMANKNINKLLSEPLDHHLLKLLHACKCQNLANYMQSKVVYDNLLNKENFEQYKHLFPEISIEGINASYEAWDIDNLTAHFEFSVNQSIINYKGNV